MASITAGPGPVKDWFRRLIEQTGLDAADTPDQADAIVWQAPQDTDGLAAILADNPQIRWVQLASAGVEHMVDAGLLTDDRVWTGMQGAYAEPVAEHALALLLAGLRHLDERAAARTWGDAAGRTLFGANVVVLGAGGIAQEVLRLLAPFRVEATLVRRQSEPGAGGAGRAHATADRAAPHAEADAPAPHRVVGTADLHSVLADADAVVVALALTPETRGIMGAAEFEAMPDHAWLVNVSRGAHVKTDDLVEALHAKRIGGAALDVTDPEPLPDGHPLWTAPRCIITPHAANPQRLAAPYFLARVKENARRFATGEELLGIVDTQHGY